VSVDRARGTRSPTVSDVARLAGVSPKTVSNVVNSPAAVSPARRKRVEDAIEAIGYRPNLAARALRTRRSQTLGIIVPTITNPHYPEVVRGAQDVADERGYAVILGNSDGRASREDAFLRLMIEQRVDGIIFQSRQPDPDAVAAVRRASIPLVLITARPVLPDCDRVSTDDESGAYQATRHLVEQGHRRIAHLAGASTLPLGVNRRNGYERALREAGIAFDGHLNVETQLDRASGRAAILHLIDSGIDFSGVFAANDLVAFGALDALRRSGRGVPGDVSLVGFDDVAEATEVDPPLTTVNNAPYPIGTHAAELLFRRIAGDTSPARSVVLTTDLVVRQSTRAIGGAASLQHAHGRAHA
jgi:LacI family transcriptional regulator, galactose operon repressor